MRSIPGPVSALMMYWSLPTLLKELLVMLVSLAPWNKEAVVEDRSLLLILSWSEG